MPSVLQPRTGDALSIRGPRPFHRTTRLHQRLAFSPFFCRATGSDGTAEGRAKRVFFPGCSLSAYAPEHVLSAWRYLSGRLEDVGVLLKCCGKPLKLMSMAGEFQKRFDTVRHDLDRMGAEEVIVACQNCYAIFRQFDGERRVRSLWTILRDTGLPEGRHGSARGLEVSVQDSCTTRDVPEIYESVRAILSELGVAVREMEYARDRARCCGCAPMIAAGDAKLGREAMKRRAAESPCGTVVSYCASCRSAMRTGGRESLHLLDLVFGNGRPGRPTPPPDRSLRSWFNRWRTRRLLGNVLRASELPSRDARGQGTESTSAGPTPAAGSRPAAAS